MKHIFPFVLSAILILFLPRQLVAAIGCTLSNPAEDLKYLYPEMTTYREDLKEFPRLKGGADLFKALRARLGSDLDPIYETTRHLIRFTASSRARARSELFME